MLLVQLPNAAHADDADDGTNSIVVLWGVDNVDEEYCCAIIICDEHDLDKAVDSSVEERNVYGVDEDVEGISAAEYDIYDVTFELIEAVETYGEFETVVDDVDEDTISRANNLLTATFLAIWLAKKVIDCRILTVSDFSDFVVFSIWLFSSWEHNTSDLSHKDLFVFNS